jgi:hypothetical protein
VKRVVKDYQDDERSLVPETSRGRDAPERNKSSYGKPRLRYLGEVRSLTAGGTDGFGDSNNPGTQDLP